MIRQAGAGFDVPVPAALERRVEALGGKLEWAPVDAGSEARPQLIVRADEVKLFRGSIKSLVGWLRRQEA